jgi:hypothetical protein
VATPASRAGARSSSGVTSVRVVSHESTNENGGVSSIVSRMNSTMSNSPRSDTSQKVDSSSPSRLCRAASSRRTAPAPASTATTVQAHDHRRPAAGCVGLGIRAAA